MGLANLQDVMEAGHDDSAATTHHGHQSFITYKAVNEYLDNGLQRVLKAVVIPSASSRSRLAGELAFWSSFLE
jgi:hypothetical protein